MNIQDSIINLYHNTVTPDDDGETQIKRVISIMQACAANKKTYCTISSEFGDYYFMTTLVSFLEEKGFECHESPDDLVISWRKLVEGKNNKPQLKLV